MECKKYSKDDTIKHPIVSKISSHLKDFNKLILDNDDIKDGNLAKLSLCLIVSFL